MNRTIRTGLAGFLIGSIITFTIHGAFAAYLITNPAYHGEVGLIQNTRVIWAVIDGLLEGMQR